MDKYLKKSTILIILSLLFTLEGVRIYGQTTQAISFGIHADPVISWFSSDTKYTGNDGARPGFNFGLTFNKYFTHNYSFSTGISILNAGGRLVNNDTTILFELSNEDPQKIEHGESVIYKIQYLSVPIGLKLQTNQIGYVTFFSDLGLDPKAVIGGKVDIPSLDITGESAMDELKMFNMSYHIEAGIEYSLGGTTAVVLGLRFDNNFFDITKDNGNQPNDKISHKILSFRIGVNF